MSVEETSTPVEDTLTISYTEEQIAEQQSLLERAISHGMGWFEQNSSAEAFAELTLKEKKLIRLLDPLLWALRDALISYRERAEGCEECSLRVETGGNSYALTVAEMLLCEEPTFLEEQNG